MGVICDICKEDIPGEDLVQETGTFNYERIQLNGELHLCGECFISAGKFIRGKEMKDFAMKYKDNFIEN